MPDPVVRSSPSLYSVPLHFMQENVLFATVVLLSINRFIWGLSRRTYSGTYGSGMAGKYYYY